MQSTARSVEEYLRELPEDRKRVLSELRRLIKKHLPKGYEEGIQYGMIGYYIPLSRYPKTYNGQALGYVGLASQKNYMSLYLMCVYGENEIGFKEAYLKTGKKLDMGKSCIRFKSLDNLPLELIGSEIERYTPEAFILQYEKSHDRTT